MFLHTHTPTHTILTHAYSHTRTHTHTNKQKHSVPRMYLRLLPLLWSCESRPGLFSPLMRCLFLQYLGPMWLLSSPWPSPLLSLLWPAGSHQGHLHLTIHNHEHLCFSPFVTPVIPLKMGALIFLSPCLATVGQSAHVLYNWDRILIIMCFTRGPKIRAGQEAVVNHFQNLSEITFQEELCNTCCVQCKKPC